MKSILEFKAWQIFIFLIIYLILTLIASIFKLSINDWTTVQLEGLFRIFGLIILTLWLFLTGLELNRIANAPHKFNNFILGLASLSFFIGYASLNLSVFPSIDSMIPMSIRILSMPLTLFGLVFLFYNIPLSLKSIELGRKAKYTECLLDALLFFSCAMGIGIWWLQPRMNKIKKTITNNGYRS